MAEAVRREESFLGLQRKNELEVVRKEWVRVEDIGVEVERAYAEVRERVLAIPGKLAAKLVGLDRTAIDLALFDEISEALSALYAPPSTAETNPLRERLRAACAALKLPSRLNLVEWAGRYRFVTLSSEPGR